MSGHVDQRDGVVRLVAHPHVIRIRGVYCDGGDLCVLCPPREGQEAYREDSERLKHLVVVGKQELIIEEHNEENPRTEN